MMVRLLLLFALTMIWNDDSRRVAARRLRISASPYSSSMEWAQVGERISGVSGGVQAALSSDGAVVAVGSPSSVGHRFNDGVVSMYRYDTDESQWVTMGQDIVGEAEGDHSGRSLALSDDGTTVAISAYQNDGDGYFAFNVGHVRVFAYDGTSWIQRGQDIDGLESFDYLGKSVSLSGDGLTIAIGATGAGVGGQVHVLEWHEETSSWINVGDPIDGEHTHDEFGVSVDLSKNGRIVAIGSSSNDDNGMNAGHARVFRFVDDEWVQFGNDIDGEAAYDRSGTSVSLSANGRTVAIGAISNDGDEGHDRGHVRVYRVYDAAHDDGPRWIQIGQDIDGEGNGDQSGQSVDLSADGLTVVIGAPLNDEAVGHVRVYRFRPATQWWTRIGQDINGEAVSSDLFGSSVSLSGDGRVVAVGAPMTTYDDRDGHVSVYTINIDCQGVLFGEDTLCTDVCGVPHGDNSTCTDCEGEVFGERVRDLCGVCGGDNSICLDCNGVLNGPSAMDECNVCGGGNSCVDCEGVPHGTSVMDECGICGGDNSTCAYDERPAKWYTHLERFIRYGPVLIILVFAVVFAALKKSMIGHCIRHRALVKDGHTTLEDDRIEQSGS